MAASEGRRKHSACLLRIRENCPFRRLRKNRCYDIQNASAEPWAHLHGSGTLPGVGRAAAEAPPGPQDPSVVCLPVPQLHLPQVEFAMDPGSIQRSPKPLHTPVVVAPGPVVLGLQPAHQHGHLTAQPSPSSMELDSGVDPETGEKALD